MPLYKPPNPNAPVLSQFSLKGKIAAVTGGAKGIGLEIVRGLAEAGADVALLYGTSRDAAEEAARTIMAANPGVRIETFSVDVANRQQTLEVFERDVVNGFGKGRLDVVVANAGACANVPALEYEEEQWRGNMGVNLDGVMWTAQAAGRAFKKAGRGSLIITASVSALLVNIPQTQAAYSKFIFDCFLASVWPAYLFTDPIPLDASKAAAVHLGKSLAVEWADFARVNVISPGFIMTEMLTKQPPELFEKWLSMIPGRRICDAAELKSVSLCAVFICFFSR